MCVRHNQYFITKIALIDLFNDHLYKIELFRIIKCIVGNYCSGNVQMTVNAFLTLPHPSIALSLSVHSMVKMAIWMFTEI